MAERGTLYLVCVAGVQTGGTLAVHQLAHVLRKLGHDARIVYFNKGTGLQMENDARLLTARCLAVHEIPGAKPADYEVWDTVADTSIVNHPANSLIVPEVAPGLLRFGRDMTKYLWWLSIDNVGTKFHEFGSYPAMRVLPFIHLVQSAYAEHHLQSHGIRRIMRLFDFTDPVFLSDAAVPAAERRGRVLFNPKKGANFVARLMAAAPELEWVPIADLTPPQVRELLRTSKVYIDFGHHPGKDRIPREAAISGCCVITGRRGAASFHPDIPIPDGYKFAGTDENVPAITAAIKDCLADFERHTASFELYRRFIRSEPVEFEMQVMRIWGTAE